MLTNLRRFAHFYFLKRKLKFHHVTRKAVNLSDAREIGILFDASETDKTAIINTFADSLRKERKKIVLLGYYDFPKPAINFNFPYFNRKNINWHFEPNGGLVDEFIARKFDILINAYVDENLPLEYLSSMSQATFRMGHYDKQKTYAYDFMIDLKDSRDLGKLVEQLKHYMEMV